MIDKIKIDLKNSYESFFHFSLDLIKTMNKDNQNLKFAVVNMQIALELFLKYYFISIGKHDWVFKDTKSPNKLEFRDFAQILDRFYSNPDILISKKKSLKHILDSRNDIVHKGKCNDWDDKLADNLINCTLFIQGLLNKEFAESLIPLSYEESEFSRNWIWRKGAEKFAADLAELNKCNVYECIDCCSKALIDKKIFTYDEYNDEGFQCITCLRDLQLHNQIELCKCTACDENSFIIDCLNEQANHTYNGCCVNCGMKYFAYKCDSCGNYFLDFDNERIEVNNHIFCSDKCKCSFDEKL